MIERWAEKEGRDTSGLVISNELERRGEDVADALYDGGTRMFTLGFGGPDYDYDLVQLMAERGATRRTADEPRHPPVVG